MDQPIATLIWCFDLWMDGFHDSFRMVETASINVEDLCRKSRLRDTNFADMCQLKSCSFEGKPCRLYLTWAIDDGANGTWIMVDSLWLRRDSTSWPEHDPATSTVAAIAEKVSAEARQPTVLQMDCVNKWELPHRYSHWTRLFRITTCARFVGNLKRKRHSQTEKKLPIQVSELNEAAEFWFLLVQEIHFSKKWNALTKNVPIPSSSSLKALKPMTGTRSLLCLNRRLRNAAIEYSEKYPVILPKHRISDLLNNHAHRAYGHFMTARNLRCALWDKDIGLWAVAI